MRAVLVALTLLISSSAFAFEVACIGQNDSLSISIDEAGQNLKLVLTPKEPSQAVISASAFRDDHDTLKDERQPDVYNLDETYDRTREARFVANDGRVAKSTVDSVIFVELSIFGGQPGRISLSRGVDNINGTGPGWLWTRIATYDCK
jgi:hypothetical protein